MVWALKASVEERFLTDRYPGYADYCDAHAATGSSRSCTDSSMAEALPEPVDGSPPFLRESGVEARIQEFPKGTPTAQDAADAVGCELGQIVKSLVFVCDDRPVVALVPGDRRGDADKVAAAVEASSARVAKPQEVEDATGFAARGGARRSHLPRTRWCSWTATSSATRSCGRAPARRARARDGAGGPRARLAGAPIDVSAD